MNSKQKGKRGELEFVHFLKDNYGIQAARTQQYCGNTGKADVDADGPLKDFHIEVKRREAGNPYDWVEQATNDASEDKIPFVAHKRNNRDWIAIIDMTLFINLLIVIHTLRGTNAKLPE